MELPNSYFEDFPIEFKQINPEDFPNFEVDEKIVISPNEEGYIKENLKPHIDLEEKNTLVINAGVGQGKTTAIIDIVKDYYVDTDYLIFIASPFVSLVEQYYNDILEIGISESDVFRYETLGNEDPGDFWNKRIHIVTANCLLGNPGEDAFVNSSVKRYYLDRLKNHCERRDKKVIFIYDEIHDAVHNFEEKYIFNLWKWRNVIQKNFIISATFNEASKIVIEYLAELTADKIQIIESERIRFPEKQSELFLHYNGEQFYSNEDKLISKLVSELVLLGKEIDILTYSKKLADDIIKETNVGIGKELSAKYENINNCTSELIYNQRQDRLIPQNRYKPDRCNVGTNFKTGVSIKKDNHAYIIVLPPKGSKLPFINNYGIFSSGIISVIQAFARQRTKGEIHLILPKPKDFNFESLPFEDDNLKDIFISFYNSVKDDEVVISKSQYLPLSSQNELLESYYNSVITSNITTEISFIESLERENKVSLRYPEYKLFKLNEGEKYFAAKHDFFGADLASYITYCAVTNQFINCKLVTKNKKPTLKFKYGEIQKGFKVFCETTYFFDDRNMSKFYFYNDTMFYEVFRNDLFETYQIKIETSEGKLLPIKQNGTSKLNKYFEQQLLSFTQLFGYPNNPLNKFKFAENEETKDGLYSRSQYFIEGISHASNVYYNSTEEFLSLEPPALKRLNAFRFLGFLRNQIISLKLSHISNSLRIFYVLNKPMINFIPDEKLADFREMLEHFLEEDVILNHYDFKSRFLGKNEEQRINTIYSIVLEDFFKTENYRESVGQRRNGKKIIRIKQIPSPSEVVNLIKLPDYDFESLPDDFFEINSITDEELKEIKEFTRRNH